MMGGRILNTEFPAGLTQDLPQSLSIGGLIKRVLLFLALSLSFSFLGYHKNPTSPEESLEIMRKTTEKGNPVAQHNLGVACAVGNGVTKDHVQAYKWLLAGVNGQYPAQEIRFLEANMTQEQMAEGRRLANEYLEQNKSEKKQIKKSD
jgi:TPR repeat protein